MYKYPVILFDNEGIEDPYITRSGNEQSSPGSAGGTSAATLDNSNNQSQPPNDAQPTGSFFSVILMYAVLFGAMYLILFRPQRKQAKALKVLRENIRPGDEVVTQSGLYGKVTDIGEDCYVIEFGTNRGVKIPVSKSEIAAIKSPKLTPPPAPSVDP